MSAHLPRILVIDDEPQIHRFLGPALDAAGYEPVRADTGAAGLREIARKAPDAVVLDLGLPDQDGKEILEKARAFYRGPIIVLSARDKESEKIDALDLGADDYVEKPFGVGELLARMRVALRHATLAASGKEEPEFVEGDLRVDLARRQVFVRSQEVHLTPLEYRLLQTLVHHAGKVVTHRHLLKEVWGINSIGQNHYLRVYMTQLRHKLEADPTHPRLLLTEPGVGYRLKVSG